MQNINICPAFNHYIRIVLRSSDFFTFWGSTSISMWLLHLNYAPLHFAQWNDYQCPSNENFNGVYNAVAQWGYCYTAAGASCPSSCADVVFSVLLNAGEQGNSKYLSERNPEASADKTLSEVPRSTYSFSDVFVWHILVIFIQYYSASEIKHLSWLGRPQVRCYVVPLSIGHGEETG